YIVHVVRASLVPLVLGGWVVPWVGVRHPVEVVIRALQAASAKGSDVLDMLIVSRRGVEVPCHDRGKCVAGKQFEQFLRLFRALGHRLVYWSHPPETNEPEMSVSRAIDNGREVTGA